jgi:hypothetical protein
LHDDLDFFRSFPMTSPVRDLLAAFDSLGASEKQQVAAEILRRSAGVGELPDEVFDDLAAELFQEYDAEEAAGANS